MRVGIYVPEIGPERGGAYTFIETVLAALSSATDSIVVFHYGSSAAIRGIDERSEATGGGNPTGFAGRAGGGALRGIDARVEFHCLAAGPLGRLVRKLWFGEVSSRLQRPVHAVSGLLNRKLPYPSGSPLDHAARARGIDLMWFPTPVCERVEVPYVVTIWDLEHRLHPYFPELAANGEWPARERYFSEVVRRAAYVVTGTAIGRDEIARFYGVDVERMRILPHPTPAFALDSARSARPSLGVPVASPFVLYPAQFWSHKNHVGLLHGVAELARRGTVVHCALVGSDKGNLEHVRGRAAALGIADRVHFLGFVSRDDLIALYRNAAALAYVSLCGPENLPPLEAMALGCPVIASDFPGAREQLGDAALLVDTRDPALLADAIQRVMDSPELRRELATKGTARAARYTQTEFGRDIQAVVDEFRRTRELWNSDPA